MDIVIESVRPLLRKGEAQNLMPVLPVKHLRLVELYIEGLTQGHSYTNKELAVLLKTTPERIGAWLRVPKVREAIDLYLQETRDKAKEKLTVEIPKSIQKVVTLRDGAEREEIQLKSAQDILDRAGITRKSESVVHNVDYMANLEKFLNDD